MEAVCARHEVYPTASYGVLLKKRSGRGIIADDVYPTEPREGVYPEERSEDFYPAERSEDVYPDERSEDVVEAD